jgi:pyridoxal phosphate enzyme (YggS family)
MPSTEDTPAARLAAVREKLARAAALAGRDANEIELIAISKTHPVEAITPLIEAGQRSFGENRVQEGQAKWPALKAAYPDLRLHLVGQLQSNKATDAVALFDAIHSLDRPSLAEALSKAINKEGRAPTLFVQVNIGEEEQKGGCAIADVPALLNQCRDLGLTIAGLMCVPPADTEPAPYFALLAKLARDNGVDQLSMGMSGDYETAAMLGATCVRVGTALFGAR